MKNNYRQSLVLTITFALLLTYYSPIFSQTLPQKTISGTITDVDGPLSGVNVLIKNTSRGTISDLDGAFSLSALPSDTLIFTYLGYKAQEVRVGGSPIFNITMEPDATALDQVVLNAGYYRVSDKEKTGSIVQVTATEIENQPISNPLAAMQGRMAGVEVVQRSGVPGSGFNVQIRGKNSLTAGNAPLYVIDGVPFSSQTLSAPDLSGSIIPYADLSPFSFLSPADIESIEVLKDADATAILWIPSGQWEASVELSKFYGITMDDIVHMGDDIPTDIVLEDKTTSEQMRLISKLDEKDKSIVFGMIETMLTKNKFKDFFTEKVAAL